MIKAKQIYDWLKDDAEERGEYVHGINDMTGEDDLEYVTIDGTFDLVQLANYLNKKEK